jgi:hypothetical protein
MQATHGVADRIGRVSDALGRAGAQIGERIKEAVEQERRRHDAIFAPLYEAAERERQREGEFNARMLDQLEQARLRNEEQQAALDPASYELPPTLADILNEVRALRAEVAEVKAMLKGEVIEFNCQRALKTSHRGALENQPS